MVADIIYIYISCSAKYVQLAFDSSKNSMVRCLIKMSKYDKQQWWVCCSSYDSDCLFRFVCKILSIKSCRVFQLHCDLREEKLPDTFAPSADERDLGDARRAGAPRT